jgi:hypothetical protein
VGYKYRRRFQGTVEDSAALFVAFGGGRSWISAFIALVDNVEAIESVREVLKEVTASVAIELVDWLIGGSKAWLMWPRFL